MKVRKSTKPETLGELIDELNAITNLQAREMKVLTDVIVAARMMARAKNITEAADMFPDLVRAVSAYEASPVLKLIRVHT